MIKLAEQINQPISGEFEERIYDIKIAWNSQDWTWIKFTNEDDFEWCGEFRGKYLGHGVSNKYSSVIVLTSDYLYQLNIEDGNIVHVEERTTYRNLTVTSVGDFIASDYNNIFIIRDIINDVEYIETEISLDMICFMGWKDSKLKILAEEFMNRDNHVELELNGRTLELSLVKQTKLHNG